MNGEELTEQETALYDRQIRVWGADAQRRLSKSHILVYGMKGTIAEFCKNIVLAGVGSLTLVDDRDVCEEALSANFLIPPDESVCRGKTLAELCCDSLREFNPMVRVSVEKGDLASLGVEFFDKFDVVVISCCSLATKKLINEKCRKLSKRVSFYTVDCRDCCGEIFVDLQKYNYAKKKTDGTTDCELQYPSFQVQRGLRTQAKRNFYQEPSCRSKAEKALCEEQSLNESHIPDTLLERLVMGAKEFPPVCAIIGGTLGQEVIKAISSKGDPLKNFFFFDATDGKGMIEDISNPNL
ncbi:hypothetical protein SADUNF_Sadunf12G0078800 [Salix dunnii]|uniref:THIF-type NAD/FAD binding fold domain-containing protein n=1 Tax=Salix dunnii TaxID=1413687 RepID=A0A835JM63_9ROSI|nr:hypothetical protein SADUNF_Sadunf12G0078800 [Salix dunnii]